MFSHIFLGVFFMCQKPGLSSFTYYAYILFILYLLRLHLFYILFILYLYMFCYIRFCSSCRLALASFSPASAAFWK